ncbi:MAG: SurA N-terminal domain-containing protein [Methylophaga sp.]|nr:SurA N-terminal domain-containing protein [Methylophaga sp.]
MLHFIREKAQGWVAWLIVGLISIPFALWGLDSYLTGGNDVVVATVNGDNVSQSDLQRSLQQYRDQMRSTLGDDFDPEMFQGSAIRLAIIDDLIEQRLILNAARELGQRIPDGQIAQFIRGTEAFQMDGQFDMDQYQMVLGRAGFTPSAYEAQLRNDLLSQQLTQYIERSALAVNHEVQRLLRLENQQRQIAYGVLSINSYLQEVTLDDNAAQEYYQANQAAYTAPEQISVRYIRLSADKLAAAIEVDDNELKAFYADNREQFVGPEQRRASHILIEGDDAEAKAKIDDLAQQLKDGADFAELAKLHSADTGSSDNGGDLGFFQRDVMDPAFEEAVFSLEVDEISEPVQTEFGYHLIKLTEIDTPAGADFADAREQIEQQYRRQMARQQFFDLADQLANLTYENPESLDVAAEALSLPIEKTGLFTRNGGGEGVSAEPKVIEAAFSDDVLNKDLNSPALELAETDLLVIRKDEYIPAKPLSFESVGPAIEEQLRYEAAMEKAQADGQTKIAEINDGAAAATVFDESQWQPAKFYSRDSDAISEQVLQHAFAMPRSQQQSVSGFIAENGNYIVVVLSDIKDGVDSDASDDQKQALTANLARLNANSEIEAFIASLRETADIEIFEDRIARTPE